MSKIYDLLKTTSVKAGRGPRRTRVDARSSQEILEGMRQKLSGEERALQAEEIQQHAHRFFGPLADADKKALGLPRENQRVKPVLRQRVFSLERMEYILSFTAIAVFVGVFFWTRQIIS